MAPAKEKKTAIVLGGGGARGAYSLGVACYLYHRAQTNTAFNFDIVVGSSCGALVGAIYYGGLFDELAEVFLNIRKRDIMRLTPLALLSGRSMYSQVPLRHKIEELIPDETLHPTHGTLAIVTTNVRTGKLVVFNNQENVGEVKKALFYSASPPVLCPPVVRGSMALSDGGYRAILPIRTAIDMGATHVLAISLSPAHYPTLQKMPESPLALTVRWIELLCGQIERHQIEHSRLQVDGPTPRSLSESRVKLIVPQDISMPTPFDFDPDKAHELYAAGKQQAADALETYDSPWDAACYEFID